MATLQKFKMLATQCGVAQSPTRSPSASPVVQFRRPKTTLRMLLIGRSQARREAVANDVISSGGCFVEKKRKSDVSGRTLKDLFVSTPPWEKEEDGGKMGILESKINGLGGGPGSPSRAGWVGFRYRFMLRRAWRPVLPSITEEDDDDE